jgi:serine protease Do
MTGLGSGFIISEEGIIVTNNHVIEGADEITVILSDETEYSAELLGRDPKADIAVLKIDPNNKKLIGLDWGDSDAMRVGDWTIAIGNPLGLGGTVTAGIVSAISRDLGSCPYVKFLQTDASINRGNSGGPLFNLDGNVIGVNTAIYSPSGGSVGIGFAIPAELAKNIVSQLQENGKTIRGWLGVRIQTVTPDLAESLGLDKPYGALVASTIPGSPAEKAGILAGDIVLEFNNNEVTEMRKLPRLVADSKVNNEADIVVWRNEKKLVLKVVIAEMKEEEMQK